jgi:hypothetical protein
VRRIFNLESAMTDETRQYRYYRYANEADGMVDRIRGYLSRRRAADWGFFLVGVLLGGLFF